MLEFFFIILDHPKQNITSGFKDLIQLIFSSSFISSIYLNGILFSSHNGAKSAKSLLKIDFALEPTPTI